MSFLKLLGPVLNMAEKNEGIKGTNKLSKQLFDFGSRQLGGWLGNGSEDKGKSDVNLSKQDFDKYMQHLKSGGKLKPKEWQEKYLNKKSTRSSAARKRPTAYPINSKSSMKNKLISIKLGDEKKPPSQGAGKTETKKASLSTRVSNFLKPVADWFRENKILVGVTTGVVVVGGLVYYFAFKKKPTNSKFAKKR